MGFGFDFSSLLFTPLSEINTFLVKTMVSWVNYHLSAADKRIETLKPDFDVPILAALLEVLTGTPLPLSPSLPLPPPLLPFFYLFEERSSQ